MRRSAKKITTFLRPRKVRARLAVLAVIFGFTAAWFTAPVPYVKNTDAEETGYKLSFKSPFVLYFSDNMNKKSVEEAFKISPYIKGAFIWKDGKTLEYHPDRPLAVGNEYEITVLKAAKNIYYKSVRSDITLQFTVTGAPFVKFVAPFSDRLRMESRTDNQSEINPKSIRNQSEIPVVSSGQPVTVMFDRPMAWPEDGYAEKLLITDPEVAGRFEFIGMSAFQFIPKNLPPGSGVTLTVPAGIPARDGGETEEAVTWELQTGGPYVVRTFPVQENADVSVNESLVINFDQPVDLDQIKPGVNILLFPSNDLEKSREQDYDGFFNTEVTYGKTEDGKTDKTVLLFKPVFPYQENTEHLFIIKSGLSGGEEKTGMEKDFELSFKTGLAPDTKLSETAEQENSPPSSVLEWKDEKDSSFFTEDGEPQFTVRAKGADRLSVRTCSISRDLFIRNNENQAWPDYNCGQDPFIVKADPDATENINLNLADIIKKDWAPGIYYISAENNNSQKIYRIFFVISTLLVTEESENKTLIWAADTKTGEPVSGMTLEFYSYEGEELGRGITDKNGIFDADKNFGEGIYIIGRKNEKGAKLYTIMNEYWVSPFDRLFTGKEQQKTKNNLLFTETDKNTVSAGGTFSIKGILRAQKNGSLKLPELPQLTLKLEGAGQAYINEVLQLRRNGSFDSTLSVPADISPGDYLINIYSADEELAGRKTITVKKEDMPFKITRVKAKSDYASDEIPDLAFRAEYSAGIPAANLKGEWELYRAPYFYQYRAKNRHYSFDNLRNALCSKGVCGGKEEFVKAGEFIFGAGGLGNIPENDFLSPGYSYRFVLKTYNMAGEEMKKTFSFKIHPAEFYLGLSLKHYLLRHDGAAEVAVLAKDHKGNVLKDVKVALSVISMLNGTEKEAVYEEMITLSSAINEISVPITKDMPAGIYKLKAESKDSKNNTVLSELEFYVLDKKNSALGRRLGLFSDQPEYLPGGKAELIINSPGSSPENPEKVFMTYKYGGVLKYQVLQLNSPLTPVKIPIDKAMAPGMDISLTAIDGGISPKINQINTPLLIGTRDYEIGISMDVKPVNPDPGDEVTVKFNTYDYQNRPIRSVITVNVTDGENAGESEGIDIINYFYGFDAFSGAGADSYARNPVQTPQENSVYFNPLVLTDESGYAEVSFILPEDGNRWGISAIATHNENCFGSAKYPLNTKKRLEITPVAPSFVMPGDEITIGAEVTNLSGENLQTAIEILSDDISLKGSAKKNLALKPDESMLLSWNAKVSTFDEEDFIEIAFRSRENYTKTYIPVKPLFPFRMSKINESVKEGDSEIKIPENAIPDAGGLKILISAAPVSLIESFIGGINKNLYDSAEKLTSMIIADIAVNKIKPENFSDKKLFSGKNTEQRIQGNIDRLKKFHREDGGYSFREKSGNSNDRLTAYVLFALSKVPDEYIQDDEKTKTIQFLWNRLKDENMPAPDKIFILWALSETREYDTGTTLTLFKNRQSVPLSAQAFLLMTIQNLVSAGQKSAAPFLQRLQSELISKQTEEDGLIYFEDTNGNTGQTTAAVLMALNRLSDDNPLLIPIVKYITSLSPAPYDRNNLRESVWIITALTEFITERQVSANYTLKTEVNKENLMDISVTPENVHQVYRAILPLESLKQAGEVNTISIEKEGTGDVYINSDLTYFLDSAEIQPLENEIIIKRAYYGPDEAGTYTKPAFNMETGQLYKGRITLVVPDKLDSVIVNVPLPAGVKAISFGQTLENESWRYQQEELASVRGITWLNNPLWHFEHHAIYDDRLFLRSEELPAGTYEIDYIVQAAAPGKYNHLPASVYASDESVYARSEGGWMEIH